MKEIKATEGALGNKAQSGIVAVIPRKLRAEEVAEVDCESKMTPEPELFFNRTYPDV
jgi:hypothetical protein